MHMPENSGYAEMLVAHFLAYSFLGKAFYEPPTVELFDTLKNDALFADWPLESDNAMIQQGLDILRRYSQQWDEAQFQDLKRDYGRLFVGPNHLLAPPWESVYRGEEGLLFDEETRQVRAIYRQHGFSVPGPGVQPDDHFGLEMMFVAHLCRLGAEALENAGTRTNTPIEQTLAAFFEDHICQWSDRFLTDVRNGAVTPYYRGMADLASGCIAQSAARWRIAG